MSNNKKTLYVEIADTPYKQRNGLMFRKDLPRYAGMLFKFHEPQILKFWGLNTYLPLDIAFISSENKIVKIGRIKPNSCSVIGSDIDCVMAIEANDGYFRSNGIKVGDAVKIDYEDNADIVIFNPGEDDFNISLKDIFS